MGFDEFRMGFFRVSECFQRITRSFGEILRVLEGFGEFWKSSKCSGKFPRIFGEFEKTFWEFRRVLREFLRNSRSFGDFLASFNEFRRVPKISGEVQRDFGDFHSQSKSFWRFQGVLASSGDLQIISEHFSESLRFG